MFAPRPLALVVLTATAIGAGVLVGAPRPSPTTVVTQQVPARIAVAHKPAPSPSTRPAAPPYVIRRVLDTGGPIRFGKWFWDDAGVPAGPVVITVDTAAEVLSIFRGGYEIGTTAVIYGADHKPTPLGVFPITQKDAAHVSSLYDAPMPYMLRLTDDGVSIHGSQISADYATHGCIGVPLAFAKKLFAAVKLGDKVVVTRGERLAVGGAVTAAH